MQHRLTVTFDIEGDIWLACRLRAELEEAGAKLNAEYLEDDIHAIDGEAEAFEELSVRDRLQCTTCGATARYANPPTDASRWDVHEPTCAEHVADGYIGLEQFDEVELGDKLGL